MLHVIIKTSLHVRKILKDDSNSRADNGKLLHMLAMAIVTLPSKMDLLRTQSGKRIDVNKQSAARVAVVLLKNRIVQWEFH